MPKDKAKVNGARSMTLQMDQIGSVRHVIRDLWRETVSARQVHHIHKS
jgi:hypothetical protein